MYSQMALGDKGRGEASPHTGETTQLTGAKWSDHGTRKADSPRVRELNDR